MTDHPAPRAAARRASDAELLTRPRLSGNPDSMPSADSRLEHRNRTRAVKAALDVLAGSPRHRKRGEADPGCLGPLAALRAEVEHQIVVAVRAAIETGQTWTAVAAELGV